MIHDGAGHVNSKCPAPPRETGLESWQSLCQQNPSVAFIVER